MLNAMDKFEVEELSLMEKLDRNYPHLINCLGLLDTRLRICNDCPAIFPCYMFQKELESPEFDPGKYRPGFGKAKRNKKYEQQWY